MESTRRKLIEILERDKESYISGQELSEKLNISRTAVWKHMKELEKDGYVIDAVSRKGYRITRFPNKVSGNTVSWGLHTNWLGATIIHKEKIESTQTLAHQLAVEDKEHGTVIIADEQTKGKGRMDRIWHSDNEQGIWMSMILKPTIHPYQAPQLTLLAATVIADVIRTEVNVKPSIKWPNDVLINDKKVAGILTEMQAEQDQIKHIVIGIGLNVNQELDTMVDEIRNLATSFSIETGKKYNKTMLIQQILQLFENRYDHFVKDGFSTIKKSWESYGYKIGEYVTMSANNGRKKVKIKGIEKDGALVIENTDGSVESIYSAEIHW